MPASKKQIDANRKNAQKSTGPKTEAGKAAVAQNALKYGVHSRHIVLNAPRLREDPGEFECLLEELLHELAPQTLFQKYLVHKIAVCLWRSRRVVMAETSVINEQIRKIDAFYEVSGMDRRCHDRDFASEDECRENCEMVYANEVGRRSFPHDARDLLYYEMRLDRQLTRSYRLLEYLQSRDGKKYRSEMVNEPDEPEIIQPIFVPEPQTGLQISIPEEEENLIFKNGKTKPISSNQKE